MRRLLAHKFEHRAKFSDYAILYRGNHQARVFETMLRAQSIPYEISGGQSMFERTEIKDIVAYLRLIANEDDDPAFVRALPRRSAASARRRCAASATSRRQRAREPVRRRIRAVAGGVGARAAARSRSRSSAR